MDYLLDFKDIEDFVPSSDPPLMGPLIYPLTKAIKEKIIELVERNDAKIIKRLISWGFLFDLREHDIESLLSIPKFSEIILKRHEWAEGLLSIQSWHLRNKHSALFKSIYKKEEPPLMAYR